MSSENRGSMFLWNFGIYLQVHVVSTRKTNIDVFTDVSDIKMFVVERTQNVNVNTSYERYCYDDFVVCYDGVKPCLWEPKDSVPVPLCPPWIWVRTRYWLWRLTDLSSVTLQGWTKSCGTTNSTCGKFAWRTRAHRRLRVGYTGRRSEP